MNSYQKELTFFSAEDGLTKENLEKAALTLLKMRIVVYSPAHGHDVTITLEERGYVFKFKRAGGWIGQCCRRPKEIRLNLNYIDLNIGRKVCQFFENTLRHEIAHAIDNELRGYSDHSHKWKALATQIGANPTWCADTAPLGINVKSLYVGTCPNCKSKTHFFRAPKNLIRSCSRCSPTFDMRYKISIVENNWEETPSGLNIPKNLKLF